MSYEPRFSYNDGLVGDLHSIERDRQFVELVRVPPHADLVLRHRARLSSTHASTAIEGNPLSASGIPAAVISNGEHASAAQVEVRNYWRALEWLEEYAESGGRLDEEAVRRLHAVIMAGGPGRPAQRSDYRQQQVVVRDSGSGALAYMGPEWGDVPPLMADLLEWVNSPPAGRLPAVVRAEILGYRFVTIHPFMDGNGRTTRALATLELWRSGYSFRGYLAMEDYYARDLPRYYGSLQMGLHHNYYFGRHDPDLTPWLSYFTEMMREAAGEVRQRSERAHQPSPAEVAPLRRLGRRQENLLMRCLTRATSQAPNDWTFTTSDIVHWYGVSERSAREWLREWSDQDVHRTGFRG